MQRRGRLGWMELKREEKYKKTKQKTVGKSTNGHGESKDALQV